MTSPAPRIAIIKLSSLGDVIHALPVARALRRALPGAHLTWVVEAREYAILRDHPDLDAVVPVDTRLWRRLIWRPSGARQVLGKVGRLRERIRRASFDAAIDLQGLLKSGLLTAYTGAPLRIGFSVGTCRAPRATDGPRRIDGAPETLPPHDRQRHGTSPPGGSARHARPRALRSDERRAQRPLRAQLPRLAEPGRNHGRARGLDGLRNR